MYKKSIQASKIFTLLLFLLLTAGQGFSADSSSFVPLDVTAENPAGGVPVGTVIAWSSSSLPPLEDGEQKWAECKGQSFSSTAYPELFAQLGTTTLPDLRGEFIRGWDHGRGVDSGRGIRSSQADQIERHKHISVLGEGNSGPWGHTSHRNHMGSGDRDYDNHWYHTNDGSNYEGVVNPPGVIGSETRPRNVAMMYLMRILP